MLVVALRAWVHDGQVGKLVRKDFFLVSHKPERRVPSHQHPRRRAKWSGLSCSFTLRVLVPVMLSKLFHSSLITGFSRLIFFRIQRRPNSGRDVSRLVNDGSPISDRISSLLALSIRGTRIADGVPVVPSGSPVFPSPRRCSERLDPLEDFPIILRNNFEA